MAALLEVDDIHTAYGSIEALKGVLDGEDVAEIRTKSEELMQASHQLAQAVYEKVQAEQQAAQPAGGDGDTAEDEVVEEADYEVIDEEAKKS